MRSRDAESELIRRLRRAGVPAQRGLALDGRGFSAGHALAAWMVFRDFGATQMDDLNGEHDGLLFQGGVYDFETLGGRRYHLDFVRQFSYDLDGEYDHMEQLHCSFLYDPTPALEAVTPENLWSFGLSLDEFYARVDQMRAFRVPMDGQLKPSGLWLAQEQV